MRKHIYLILFLLPVVLWLTLFLYLNIQTSDDPYGMTEVEGMVMGEGQEQLTVFRDDIVDGEAVTHVISLRSPEGKAVHEETITIDYDMFGRSVIKAMQLDNDPELEILAWGSHIIDGESFYLDYKDGRVEKMSYESVPQGVKEFIKNRTNTTGMATVLAGLLVLVTPVYYIVLLIVYFINRLKNKNRVEN